MTDSVNCRPFLLLGGKVIRPENDSQSFLWTFLSSCLCPQGLRERLDYVSSGEGTHTLYSYGASTLGSLMFLPVIPQPCF